MEIDLNNIPLASPDLRQSDIDRVINVLKSGQLVQGKLVSEVEGKISNLIGTSNSRMVSNGTATMHLALLALGIGKGDEVIVPAFSYVATANVVELVGAKSVFVDIDLKTFNIDENKIIEKINSRTKAIIPVHEFGLPCNIDKIINIAKENNLKVIEDAACAFGATFLGKHVGTFGDFGSFSFHPRKAVTSGEGGCLVINDQKLVSKIEALRNHGIQVIDGNMQFVEAGFNYRMTEFQAALLIGQLDRTQEIIKTRSALAEAYEVLIVNPNIIKPVVTQGSMHSWQTYHLIIENKGRDEVISKLKEEGVGSNYGAQCIPLQDYYLKKYNLNCEKNFPNAVKAFKCGLAIPLYEKLSIKHIEKISNLLNRIV